MNINRNTYESYFLLYVDNELSAEERVAVETFVEENPDLRQELQMLQDAVLSIDEEEAIEFADKNSLLRFSPASDVNATNYQEYFLLFADGELTPDQQKQVLAFVEQNPSYNQEFELIQQCKLSPDESIVFENKESLYRYEKPRRVVPFLWKQMAAAAVFIFLVGAGWFFSNREKPSETGMASVEQPKTKTKPPVRAQEEQPNADIPNNPQQSASNANVAVDAKEIETIVPKSKVVIETMEEPIKSNIASVKTKEKKSLVPSNKITELDVQQETTELAKNNLKVVNPDPAKVIPEVENQTSQVITVDSEIDEATLRQRSGMAAASVAQQETESNVVYVANTSVSKKNKLRGFFRTASRIVERATSFEPSSKDKDGIRIANFEIDLK